MRIAIHYLVKPFSDEKFASVLCNAAEQYQKSAEVTEKGF